jgi:hypothetical protein
MIQGGSGNDNILARAAIFFLVTLAGRGGSTHHSRDPSGLSAIIAAYLEQVNEHGGRDEMIY